MSHKAYYVPGAWNALCSICGRPFKSHELVKHWQGLYRCAACWESRHTQDFVRNNNPERAVIWTQPDCEHPAIAVCTPNGQSAVPAQAVPGCMIPGYLHPFFDPSITT